VGVELQGFKDLGITYSHYATQERTTQCSCSTSATQEKQDDNNNIIIVHYFLFASGRMKTGATKQFSVQITDILQLNIRHEENIVRRDNI